MSTIIRSSTQLYVDENLQFNAKKAIGLTPGTMAGDSVEYSQLITVVNNAVAGSGNSIHEPVGDVVLAKAIPKTDSVDSNGVVTVPGRADKMIMLIEQLGLFRYDDQSIAVSNDTSVIRPTDVGNDAVQGRWLKISSTLTDHALLDNILGNGGYHLSIAERDKLTGIEAGADVTDAANVGSVIGAAATNATPADSDHLVFATGSLLSKATFAVIKAFFKTYFDTLYNNFTYAHPNHSGDVTSVADGVQTIAANAVNNAKLADMAPGTIKGRLSTPAGDPEDITLTNLKVALGYSVRNYRYTPGGVVNGSNAVFTIAALVVSGTEEVFKNGLLMNAGAGNDYTISYGSTTTITFATAPSGNGFSDVILVNYSA